MRRSSRTPLPRVLTPLCVVGAAFAVAPAAAAAPTGGFAPSSALTGGVEPSAVGVPAAADVAVRRPNAAGMRALRRGLRQSARLRRGPGARAAQLGGLAPDPAAADDGARITGLTYVRERVYDLAVDSPAMSGPVRVRLVFPRRWANTAKTFPTLYLFHGWGGEGEVTAWTDRADMVAFTKDKPVIVATPYAPGGAYSNWSSPAKEKGRMAVETFHTEELPQLLERNLLGSGRRAAAGLSTGATGALAYAARHPGLFGAAGSFSGMLDTQTFNNIITMNYVAGVFGGGASTLWGDALFNGSTWRAHNPIQLTASLRGVGMFFSSGNGTPTDLDPPGTATNQTEMRTLEQLNAMRTKLNQAGIPATYDTYGPGTHQFPYFSRELHRAWPVLAAGMGLDPALAWDPDREDAPVSG